MRVTNMLAWLFKCRTFVTADFIEKAWALRNMSIHICCVYPVPDVLYCIVYWDCVWTTGFV
jgi:hypothetical protein